GLEPEHSLKRVGRDRLIVVRHIVMRGAVEHASRRIDQLDVHHLAGMFGALKHHVFEEVREAAAAARLQAKSNVVVDTHGHYRRYAVGRNDDAQAVGELVGLDRNLQLSQWVSSSPYSPSIFQSKHSTSAR